MTKSPKGRLLVLAALAVVTRLLTRGATSDTRGEPAATDLVLVCRELGPPLTSAELNATLPAYFEESETKAEEFPAGDPSAAIEPRIDLALAPSLQLVSLSVAETEQLCARSPPPLLLLLAVAVCSACAGALLARGRAAPPPRPVETAERKEEDARCCAASTTSEVPRIGAPDAEETAKPAEHEAVESSHGHAAAPAHGWRRVGDGRLASVVPG